MLRIQKYIYIQWFLNKLGVFNFKISWADGKFKYFQSQISWLWGNTYLFLFTSRVIFLRGLFFLMFDMEKKTYPGAEKNSTSEESLFNAEIWPPPSPRHYSTEAIILFFIYTLQTNRSAFMRENNCSIIDQFSCRCNWFKQKKYAFLKPKLDN